MQYLKGSHVKEQIDGIIHAETQQHDYETDLTVAAVYEIIGPGALDFGGSEFAPAKRVEMTAVKRSTEDSYGWWDLPPGTYVVRYNEVPNLEEDQIALLQPHERLLSAGASHATIYFRGQRDHIEMLLDVGDGGVNIKENARITKLLILSIDD